MIIKQTKNQKLIDNCKFARGEYCNEFDCPNTNDVCPNSEIFNEEQKDYTCSDCYEKEWCKYAYDPYCTDGDCLAIK